MSMDKTMLGSWRAKVVSVEHPQKLYKVQIQVLGLWEELGPAELPWAEYRLPLGTRANMGGSIPCEVGDLVWVEFDQGDSRCPIITGACHYAPGGVLNMPHEAFGGPEAYQHKRTDDEPKPEAAAYHANLAFSLHNILIELTKESALRFTHKPTGSAVELTSAGDILLHGEKNITQTAAEKWTVFVVGNIELNTKGDYAVKADGKMSFEAGGTLSFKGTNAEWKLG